MVKKVNTPRYKNKVDRDLFKKQNMQQMVNFCISQIAQGLTDIACASRAYPYDFSSHHQRELLPQLFSITVVKVPEGYTARGLEERIIEYLYSMSWRERSHSYGRVSSPQIGMDHRMGAMVERVKDEFESEESFLVFYGESNIEPITSVLFEKMYKEDTEEKEADDAILREKLIQQQASRKEEWSGTSFLNTGAVGFDFHQQLDPAMRTVTYSQDFIRERTNPHYWAPTPPPTAGPIPGTSRDRRDARAGRNVPRQGQSQASQSQTLRGLLRNI